MSHRLALLAGAVGVAILASCDRLPTSDAPASLPTVDRVVLVSIDGLRADALSHMPTLSALAARGRWSDSARTVVPSMTVPGHLSMLSGRDVTLFGITGNAVDTSAYVRFVLNGGSTVFDWVRGAQRRSAAVAGASLVPPDRREDVQQLLGVDSLVATTLGADAVATEAIALAGGAEPPALLFVHFADADLAGHASGWTASAEDTEHLGAGYLAAVARIDAALARLWDAIAPEVEAGRMALLVTADHGGGAGEGCVAGVPAYEEHCTASDADRRIPIVLVSEGIEPGRVPGSPRITQVAATVGRMLGLYVPGGADGGLTN